MILNLFRRNEYFVVVELRGEKKSLDTILLTWIKNRFWWRGKKVAYFEPFTNKQNKTYFIAGTPNRPNAIKRTCLIFLLELFAHLENKNIPLTFKGKTIEKFGYALTLYKIPKNLR